MPQRGFIEGRSESMNIDHHKVCFLNCRDCDEIFVLDRGPVARTNSYTVDVNYPRRWNKVGKPQFAKHIRNGLATP